MNTFNRHAVSACVAVALVSAIAGAFFDESRTNRDVYAIAQPSRLSSNSLATAKPGPTGPRGEQVTAPAVAHTRACAPSDAASPRTVATPQSREPTRCEPPAIAAAAAKEVSPQRNS